MLAPSTSAFSFIFATMRASGFMPQSLLNVTLSAGMCLIEPPDPIGDLRRRLDRVGPDVEHAELDALVGRQTLEEVHAVHVAVGVIQHELVDARRAEEVRQHGLVALRIVGAEDVVAPGVPEAEVPADLRVHAVAAHLDALADPLVVVLVVGEERQPRAEVLELQVGRASGHERLHLRVEDRAERHGQVLGVLVVLEVDVPRQVGRAGAHRHLHRHLRVLCRDLVEVRKPDWAVGDGAAVDDAAPVVHDGLALGHGTTRIGRVLLARLFEAADAFVHVPAERADDADVVVVPHVAVGDDVEAHVLLFTDHGGHGVVVRLFVLHFLERDPDVPTEQLVLEPVRPRVRPDHGRREELVYDFLCHVILYK